MKTTAIMFIALATLLLIKTAPLTEAACVVTELAPCLPAITTGGNPSAECCGKLKEQESCLCGYVKNPAFAQYVSSPNARKVLSACGVPYPSC
ncbi:PREDICTED: probable non-specific lipid-transfer protein AKCS9 [Tarenaya hassleriana]|uniref:probable non-specific lipid-transfer protein AKCS9 n=1 Tax=Tarenaya hassleriana TaxID=28532 RepID=UPI00053C51E5|nr:PREDICTED: probable non-specific lipid-transfer protein AKCS9 [Tarenaya hassleriana]